MTFVDGFESKHVRVHFDTGNIMLFQFPEHWIPILGPRIKNVHFKEFSKKGTDHSAGVLPHRSSTAPRTGRRSWRRSNRSATRLPHVRVFPSVLALSRSADLSDFRCVGQDHRTEGMIPCRLGTANQLALSHFLGRGSINKDHNPLWMEQPTCRMGIARSRQEPNGQRNPAETLRELKASDQPVVLTINGQAELLVRDATSRRKLIEIVERSEEFESLRVSIEEMKAGKGRPIEELFAEMEQILAKKTTH